MKKTRIKQRKNRKHNHPIHLTKAAPGEDINFCLPKIKNPANCIKLNYKNYPKNWGNLGWERGLYHVHGIQLYTKKQPNPYTPEHQSNTN